MDLTHRLSVPASRDDTWNAFTDPERLAHCFPGAKVTGIDGDSFTGTVKVKLGPLALVYAGTGTYVQRDAGRGRLVIETEGRDTRGNGTATTAVAATFTARGDQTDVELRTALSIDGKPGQLGAAIFSDVGDKLFDQFASCLSGCLVEGSGELQPDLLSAPPVASRPTVELGAGLGDIREADPLVAPHASGTAQHGGATGLPGMLKRYWPVLGGAAAALFVVSRVAQRARR